MNTNGIPLYNEIKPSDIQNLPIDSVEIEIKPVELKDTFSEPTEKNTESNTVGVVPVTGMKLQKEVVDLLNARIGDEYKAHYFYRCATNFLRDKNYKKATAFFEKEAQNELEHAKGLQDYLVDFNIMPCIPQVETDYKFEGLVDVINKSYALELNLMRLYNENSAAIFSMDLTTFDFLQKYREHQKESVVEFNDLLNAASLVNTQNPLDLLYFENTYFEN